MNISKNEYIARIKNYLCPPGDGVFTVHTAKDKKIAVQKKIYGEEAILNNQVKEKWEMSLEKTLPISKTVLLGIPSDCGGGIQRGANWGPLFLRKQLIDSPDELNIFDIGDIRVIPHLLHDKYLNEETISTCREALYENKNIKLPVSPLSIAYDFAINFHEHFPAKHLFSIGGDHSVSYPLVRAYLESKKKQNIKVALIHFDAHTDLSTSRLGIDLCFGTWAAQIMPYLETPDHLIQIGIRSSAKDRGHWEKTFKHTQIWANEVLEQGPEKISNQIIEQLKKLNIEELYISFDIDCLDEQYAGATGTPETSGLSPFEPMFILQHLFENFKITGADITEIAPMVKAAHLKQIEPETTLMVAQSFATFLIQAMGAK